MFIFECLVLALVINFVVFLIAFKLQTDKLTDITWALTFVVLMSLQLYKLNQLKLYNLILALMIFAWAARLGAFLLIRVFSKRHDSRFDGIRNRFFGYMKFWLGQGLAAWVLLLPTFFANKTSHSFAAVALIGLVVWLIGISTETVADIQKYRFSNRAAKKHEWIDTGLWKFSRHPNYFGEILVWIGVYLYCLNTLSVWEALVSLASPLLIYILLRFVSGIPILEKRADARWGKLDDYNKYKQHSRLLLPLPK